MKHKEVILIGIKDKEISHFNMSNLITVIGNNCFKDSSMKNIKFSNELKYIRPTSFNNCVRIAEINLTNTKLIEIGNYAFSTCSSIKSIRLPESLCVIRAGAFDRCSELTQINIPDRVKKLDIYTFYKCIRLKSINLNNAKYIDDSCFYNCFDLEKVESNRDDAVTLYGQSVFKFTKIELPKCNFNVIYER